MKYPNSSTMADIGSARIHEGRGLIPDTLSEAPGVKRWEDAEL